MGPQGYADPEDVEGGQDVLLLPLGPRLEIGSDGRLTGAELELPSDEEDGRGGPYSDAGTGVPLPDHRRGG